MHGTSLEVVKVFSALIGVALGGIFIAARFPRWPRKHLLWDFIGILIGAAIIGSSDFFVAPASFYGGLLFCLGATIIFGFTLRFMIVTPLDFVADD